MIKSAKSTHKSIMIAIREAGALYLFDRNREKDIPKITEIFLSLDDYPGDRVPIAEVVREVNALSDILQDHYLGLNLNMLVDIESLPFYKAIDECIRPFSNINNELPFLLVARLVIRFFPLMTESINLKLKIEKGLIQFEFISNAPKIMNKNQIDGAMVLVYRILEVFCPKNLKSINVAHRQTSYDLGYYQTIFGVQTELANKTSLVYEIKCENHYRNTTTLLKKSEEELGRTFFISPLANMLATEFTEMSYKQRCEVIIDTIIGVTPITRSNVAKAMNTSISTLQRKLRIEGSSFQDILEETRKRLAKLYLTENKLPTTDVAYLLGYQASSQFFKAFKGWFGMTPRTYQVRNINIDQAQKDTN